MAEEKKQPKKRIQLVDVVLERKGSQMFEGRRVRSPEDAANIIRDFIGDSDIISCTRCTNNSDNSLQFMKIHWVS